MKWINPPSGGPPRSVPATYAGFFDEIRRLFAQTPEARLRGYSAGRFSFNSPQGRCPGCLGAGQIKLEMSFMPPAFVPCETCRGTRFNPETLEVRWRDRNIAQTLDLTVAQAARLFAPFPKIARPLQALCDTGLDYIKLGQASPTLSGGEAQRLKLVAHLLAGFRARRTGPRAAARAPAAANRLPSSSFWRSRPLDCIWPMWSGWWRPCSGSCRPATRSSSSNTIWT